MKDVPSTFKQTSHKLYDISTSGKSNVVFSMDMYKSNSIKSMERQRRGCGEKHLIKGENTKRPEFLSNDENKQQLMRLILKVWSGEEFSSKLCGKSLIAICEEKAYNLISSDGKSVAVSEIPHLQYYQEETDTRVIVTMQYNLVMSMSVFEVLILIYFSYFYTMPQTSISRSYFTQVLEIKED